MKITVVLEEDLGGGPADETVRSGIGYTSYEIDLSDRSRIPDVAGWPGRGDWYNI
jgi:hypothetical protein